MSTDVSINTQTGKLLLDESPLVVLPSLAEVIGLESAVVLQQLHFLIRSKLERHKDQPKDVERDVHDGRIWIWNSYQQWREKYFRFLSVRSLQRIFLDLEKRGLIVSGKYNQSSLDKTKWYSINYDHPLIKPLGASESKSLKIPKSLPKKGDRREKVVDCANLASSTSQAGAMDSAKKATSYTKTSYTKISTNTITTSESSSDQTDNSSANYLEGKTFPVPKTQDEVDQIVRGVIRIEYPFEDKVGNKSGLVSSLKKKLKKGSLEVPEGWGNYQREKKAIAPQNSENKKMIAEEKEFSNFREEYENLPQNEQHKYLEAARKTMASVAKVASEANITRLAISLWSQERNKKSDIKQVVQ